MGITKEIISEGDSQQLAKKQDEVVIEYTGWIHDPEAPEEKGQQFDTSVGRGDTVTVIGIGRVLKGWDKGIAGGYKSDSGEEQAGMALGEKSRFTFSSEYGYGANGFPGIVPKNATLIFEIELKRINPQRAP
jgi:FK506-binding protein 1